MNSAILIKNLSLAYSKTDAINNINLSISEGEFVNIVGPNGGGKTTLVKCVLGLLKPQSGDVSIFGKNVNSGKTLIGYVPQNADTEKNFPITALETVQTAFLKPGLNPFKKLSLFEKEKSLELLSTVGLSDLAHRQVNQLSGGEFQRLLIARALAGNTKILLLDEPTANIDPISTKKIYEILSGLNKSGITVILVSHDLRFVLKSQRRTVYIDRNIIFDGIADEKIYSL